MLSPLAPYPAAAVNIGKTRMLAVADLHIGWEMMLSDRGIHVPKQTPKLLTKLMELLSVYRPEKLLILGDVKHTVATAEKIEWQDVPDFFVQLREQVKKISVIKGNHDGNLEPLLPENIDILPSTGVALKDIGFFHGHQWPSSCLLTCKTLVMGHVHPVVAFRDPAGFRVTRQVWVKISCDPERLSKILLQKHKVDSKKKVEAAFKDHHRNEPKTSQLFIMPSFNDFLGGRPLNERRPRNKLDSEMIAGPVLRSDAVDLKNAETYLLDGTYLGTLEQLRNLS